MKKQEEYTAILCELIFAAMKNDEEIPEIYSLESIFKDDVINEFVLALCAYAPGIILNKLTGANMSIDEYFHHIQMLFNNERIEKLLAEQREELEQKYKSKEK